LVPPELVCVKMVMIPAGVECPGVGWRLRDDRLSPGKDCQHDAENEGSPDADPRRGLLLRHSGEPDRRPQ
jgi:hypothetical protein